MSKYFFKQHNMDLKTFISYELTIDKHWHHLSLYIMWTCSFQGKAVDKYLMI